MFPGLGWASTILDLEASCLIMWEEHSSRSRSVLPNDDWKKDVLYSGDDDAGYGGVG